jgi:hypothetical protein
MENHSLGQTEKKEQKNTLVAMGGQWLWCMEQRGSFLCKTVEHFAYKIKKISNGALTSTKDLDLLPSSIIIHRTPDFWSHNSSNTSVGVLVLASPSDIVVGEGVELVGESAVWKILDLGFLSGQGGAQTTRNSQKNLKL